ncbi:MAG: secretin N-terminal domain-containing protein, partial [Aliarcobacter sp.]|nr:secretin N-terminal domain-containing protein [Aliarcobacter sp.]
MKLLLVFFLIFSFSSQANTDDKININFKDLKISDFIMITSKIINKNILFTDKIEGTMDFIPNKEVSKSDLLKILDFVLEEKGYVLIDEKNILRVVKSSMIEKDTLIIKLNNLKASEAKKKIDLISAMKFNKEEQKIAIIEDENNNSLTLLGQKKDLKFLSDYIRTIDNTNISNKKDIKIFPLKNVEASTVVKILEEIINKKEFINPNDKPLFSIDNESNSIVIMGLAEEISQIDELIKELDKEKTQVYVQARIIEVNDELVNQIGVSYGIFGARASNNVLSSFSSSLNNADIPT